MNEQLQKVLANHGVLYLLPNPPVKNMVIDMSGVNFMDSAGIGLIMGRMNRVSSVGGKLSIKSPKPQIKKLLKLSKIESIVEM